MKIAPWTRISFQWTKSEKQKNRQTLCQREKYTRTTVFKDLWNCWWKSFSMLILLFNRPIFHIPFSSWEIVCLKVYNNIYKFVLFFVRLELRFLHIFHENLRFLGEKCIYIYSILIALQYIFFSHTKTFVLNLEKKKTNHKS